MIGFIAFVIVYAIFMWEAHQRDKRNKELEDLLDEKKKENFFLKRDLQEKTYQQERWPNYGRGQIRNKNN